jgi:hypothetical protein
VYIEKMSALEDKFDLFVELKAWRRAIECAQRLKDPHRLNEVGRMCNDEAIGRQVQELISRM